MKKCKKPISSAAKIAWFLKKQDKEILTWWEKVKAGEQDPKKMTWADGVKGAGQLAQ